MGFIDNIKKMTQPINDADDDMFEGADEKYRTPAEINRSRASANASAGFDGRFGIGAASAPIKAEDDAAPADDEDEGSGSGLFGNINFSKKKLKAPSPRRKGGSELMVFAPLNLNEMLELKQFLTSHSSVILRLDGLPDETARRLLDFASGMAYGLDSKISPISGKTYLVSDNEPSFVTQAPAVESDERYL